MNERSVILLDVDGVLNCLPEYDEISRALGTLRVEDVRLPEGVEEHVVMGPRGREVTLRIRPEIKKRVAHLATLSEVVWCTSWGDTVDSIAHHFGLPTGLRRVWLPDSIHGDGSRDFSVKAPFVRTWAHDHGVHRLVWIDDQVSLNDEGFLLAPRREPPRRIPEDDDRWRRDWRAPIFHTDPVAEVLCLPTNPHVGLLPAHVQQAEEWLTGISMYDEPDPDEIEALLADHGQAIVALLNVADWQLTGWALDEDDPSALVLLVEDSAHTTRAAAQPGLIAQVRISQLLQRTCVVVHTARQDEHARRLIADARPVPEANHE